MFYKLYKKDHAKGFTLIELLVVIAIIGILATIVLASLNSARERSRDAKRVADLRNMQSALELYFDDNREYPTAATLLVPEYVSALPLDPTTNVVYTYTPEADPATEYVYSGTLESPTHSAYSSDYDGAAGARFAGSPNCVDPVYCVTN